METFTVDRMVVETGQTEQSQLISISVLFFFTHANSTGSDATSVKTF